MKSKDVVTIVIVTAAFLFTLMIISELVQADPSYVSGTVIATNESKREIEVRLGEIGPRIFVTDLGNHDIDDIQYGDTVRLEFYRRFYKLTEVQSPDESETLW